MIISKWKYVSEEVCDICLGNPQKEQVSSVKLWFNERFWWGHSSCISNTYEDYLNFQNKISLEDSFMAWRKDEN